MYHRIQFTVKHDLIVQKWIVFSKHENVSFSEAVITFNNFPFLHCVLFLLFSFLFVFAFLVLFILIYFIFVYFFFFFLFVCFVLLHYWPATDDMLFFKRLSDMYFGHESLQTFRCRWVGVHNHMCWYIL